MRDIIRAVLTGAVVVLATLAPAAALAQPPEFTDTDGDGVMEPPEGFPGDLDAETGGTINARLADEVARAEALQDADTGAFVEGRCGGWAVSYDADGNRLDGVFRSKEGGPIVDWAGEPDDEDAEPGVTAAMTASNPFVVDSGGQVVYYGELENAAGEGPADHEWAIKTGGISLDAGGDDNPDRNNRNAGVADLGANLPVPLTGTVKVTGTLRSQNGADCEGVGFVRFVGPPGIATPVGAAGALFAGVGIVGLLLNSRPAITWKA